MALPSKVADLLRDVERAGEALRGSYNDLQRHKDDEMAQRTYAQAADNLTGAAKKLADTASKL